jgi:Cof subfamily protein (haloacid dehalogenase superfamily)
MVMNEDKNRDDSPIRTVPSETAADVRLLVLDIDGTIVDESNRIRDSVIQAIHSAQRRGVAVAIATGRRYPSALHAYHSIGSTLPLICYEGALIREPKTGFVHRHWHLEPRVAAQILDYAAQLGDRLSVHFHVQDELYVSNLNSASIKFFEGSKVEPIVVGDLRQLLNPATTKVIVLGDDFQLIARLSSRLKNSHCRTQIRQYKSITVLEAFHPIVNKRLALTYLTEEILGLRPENVIAIGDDFTDIGMLQYAGIGVAMGNAPAALKRFADWVTTTIEQDGVARAVERFILGAATVRLGAKPVGSFHSLATLNRLS